MEKTRVLGIAPYEGIHSLMKQVAEHREEIELTSYVGDLKEGLSIASKYSISDFDIIMSRGGTAELIRNSCSIPVVEISLSAIDILRSLKLVQNVNKKYALIGFPAITKNAQLLCDVLQYNIDIYTIHNEQDAKDILAILSKDGNYIILCDMVTYSLAQTIGLTAILINSGLESIEIAFDQAIETKRTYELLSSQINFYKTLPEYLPLNLYVYNEASEIIYQSENEILPEDIKKEIENNITLVFAKKTSRIHKVLMGLLYVINGVYITCYNKPHVLFYISTRKVPLSLIKDGIQYLSLDEANNKLFKSFFGITQSIIFPASSINMYAESNSPIMIIGEEGTGKEYLVYILYTKSKSSNNPLVVMDCSRFLSKDMSFLTDDNISPLSDTSTTIYVKNMELLSEQQFNELFSIIQDLHLSVKNRIIFTFTNDTNETTVKRYSYIINHLSCLTIRVPALRDSVEHIPALANIYVNILNVAKVKEVLGFEEEALSVMKAYPWPGNYNQFRKIINELVTITNTPYIKASAVTKLLQKELPTVSTKADGIHLSLTDKTLEDLNLEIVQQVLSEENGNQSSTAQRLGISRTTLWRMLQRITYPS